MMYLVTKGLYLNDVTCIDVDSQCPHSVWMPLEVCVPRPSCLMSRYGSYVSTWYPVPDCWEPVVMWYFIYITSTKMLNLCISNVSYMFLWGWTQQSQIVDCILLILSFPSFNHLSSTTKWSFSWYFRVPSHFYPPLSNGQDGRQIWDF